MRKKSIKMIIIVISLIIIDQLSKIYIINNFNKSIGNEIIKIELAKNYGIAFGLNSGNSKNIIITIIVLMIVFIFIKNQFERIDVKTGIAISMIIGGGVSNLIDRIFRGYVVDFISVKNFSIFNLADIYIVIGWILFVIFIIKFSKK